MAKVIITLTDLDIDDEYGCIQIESELKITDEERNKEQVTAAMHFGRLAVQSIRTALAERGGKEFDSEEDLTNASKAREIKSALEEVFPDL